MIQIAGKIVNCCCGSQRSSAPWWLKLVLAAVVVSMLFAAAKAVLALIVPVTVAFSEMASFMVWIVIALVLLVLLIALPRWGRSRMREAEANREAMRNWTRVMTGLEPVAPRPALPPKPVYAVSSRGTAVREEIER